VLLFVVLFFVYPLKFLASFLLNMFTGGRGMVQLKDGRMEAMVQNINDTQTMMIVYGLGYFSIYFVFVLLYWQALRKRDQLKLTPHEEFLTRVARSAQAVSASFGLLSVIIVLIGGTAWTGWAGVSYVGIGFAQWVHGALRGRQGRRLGLQEEDW
jgi:hypothetical protein